MVRPDDHHSAENAADADRSMSTIPNSEQDSVDPAHRAQELLRQGRLPEALEIYDALSNDHPEDVSSWMMQGIIHSRMGNLVDAERCCLQAVALAPNSAQPHFFLAKVYELQGNRDKAIASFQTTLSINPRSIQTLTNLGILLDEACRYQEAESKFREALRIAPDNAAIICNLAFFLEKRGYVAETEKLYRKLLQIQPQHADAHLNLANLLISQNRGQEALAQLDSAIAVKPDFPQAWYNRGKLLEAEKRYPEAAESYLQALHQRPDHVAAYISYSGMLFKQGKFDEALRYAKTAVEVGGDNAVAHNNLGILLRLQNHYDEAEVSLRKALAYQPDHAHAHWNLSLVLLARGKLSSGWQEYEWGMRAGIRNVAKVELPTWDGKLQGGQRILILMEQGIGDEVMFASCVPDIVALGLDCILECRERLMPLLARSFPQVRVIVNKGADEPVEKFLKRAGPLDVQIAEGSLPRYFRHDFEDFPRRRSYLIADSLQVRTWKKRYERFENRLKVGISWLGGANEESRRLRSTDLPLWSEVLSTPGVAFIDLQYGDTTAQREVLRSQTGLVIYHFDEADPLHDMDAFAAQIAALDLVISVDNSTVHLAGALGVPTWVLLPYVADWRWFLDRDDSPWYESVRLIRRQHRAEWKEVFENVARMLHEFVGQNRASTL